MHKKYLHFRVSVQSALTSKLSIIIKCLLSEFDVAVPMTSSREAIQNFSWQLIYRAEYVELSAWIKY